MKINLLSLAVLLAYYGGSFGVLKAQNNTLLQIENKQYSIDEFNYIYNKNNSLSKDPVSKKEYIDLFVNYKLKVHAAIDQGYDTLPSFVKELNYYRNELAKPYLSDKKVSEELAQEAYNRLLEEVDASHILIRLPKDAYPSDTLTAYKKIEDIRHQAVNGADFGELAMQYSQDPSAKQNKGRLGYFSGFMMVYPFESAAYNTPVGEISNIVRSSFGYHILHVHDKRKSRGEIRTAHIMKIFPRDADESVKEKAHHTIDSIYQLLQSGGNFNELAKEFSDDRNSANNGGELPWFGTGKMIPEFADAAFAIEADSLCSKPIQTPFGWHIIRRLEHRPVKSFEEMHEEIHQRISRDERALSGRTATLNRLKQEYNFSLAKNALSDLKHAMQEAQQSDSLFYSQLSNFNAPMAHFSDTTLNFQDFSNYLKKQPDFKLTGSPLILDKKLQAYCDDHLIDYEKSRLEKKYPDFRFLMNEYHDGLLIFEISQKEIWNKASEDSTGLQAFYETNKMNYATPATFEGDLYFFKAKKVLAQAEALLKDTAFNADSLKKQLGNNVVVQSGIFKQGTSPLSDWVIWKKGSPKKLSYPKKYSKTIVKGQHTASQTVELKEIKGQVISDYQTYLETQWIQSLRDKYNPQVNKVALKKTKS
jgi:peptidyl-prolyl cis-trans isomerase SurA